MRADEPFVEKLEDVGRIIAKLEELELQVAVAYAIGALAGLRTGEIIGLAWNDIDLDRGELLHQRKIIPRSRLVKTDRDGQEMYLTWYQATRHTFASHSSHDMMAGGNLSKLQAELGHSDIQTTQRYAKIGNKLVASGSSKPAKKQLSS
jgi:integrase